MIEIHTYCAMCGSDVLTEMDRDDGSVMVYPCSVCMRKKDTTGIDIVMDLAMRTWYKNISNNAVEETWIVHIDPTTYQKIRKFYTEHYNE